MNVNPHIFLDIDGVIALTAQFYSQKRHPDYNCYRFDRKSVDVLNDIINGFKPIIILSSDWKHHYSIDEMNNIFKWNDLNCVVYDTTPTLWGIEYFKLSELEICRAMEILAYVESYEIRNYVAVDDLNLSKWIPDNFVRTPRANEGIKQTGVKENIIEKFNKFQK